MKKNIFASVFFLGALPFFAQQATVTAGGEASGTGGTVSFSVGQVDYSNATGTSGDINQGVQQPFEISVINGKTENTIALSASVFPNPALNNSVTLNVTKGASQDLYYCMFNANGTQIKKENITSDKTTINMAGVENGIYIVKVYDLSSELKSFKLIKNQ
jgi:hypothetical protein